MAKYATSALKLSDTYVNTLPYNTCSTAAGSPAKEVSAGEFALNTGAMVVVKFTVTNTASSPTLNVSETGAKSIYYNNAAITAGYLKANKIYPFIYDGTYWQLVGDVDTDTNTNTNYYHTPTVAATGSNLTGNTGSSNTKIGTGSGVSDMYVPVATANSPGTTVVYPAASCTTFSSDAGTVTPLAVQKGAKMFAITRPPKKDSGEGDTSVTVNAIPRWEDSTGDLKNSKITIEDVTNTKDTSKKANVLVIPAEGGKKMVYGYCTDQVDGTSFIGGVFDANATSYPYASGLAIGGTSGNLLWKGKQVATTDMIPTIPVNSVNGQTGAVVVPGCYTGKTAAVSSSIHTLTINERLPALPSSGYWLIPVLCEFTSTYTSGQTVKITGKYGSGTTNTSFTTSAVVLKTMQNNNAPTNSVISGVPNMIYLKFNASTLTGAWINSTAIWA